MNSTITDPASTEHIKINNNNNNKKNNKIRPTTDSQEGSINNSVTKTEIPAKKPGEEESGENNDCNYDIESDSDIPYALHDQEALAACMKTDTAAAAAAAAENEEDEAEKRTDIDEEEFSNWNNANSENYYSGEEQENNVYYAPAQCENNYLMGPEAGSGMPTDMNYSPSAMMMRAPSPSSSSSVYNLQYPCQNPLAAPAPPTPLTSSLSNTHVMLPNNIPPQISSRLQNPYAYGHRQNQHHQNPYSGHHPSEPSRVMPHLYTSHPNMWYPNAPFGHYRGGYGRQQPFAHHPEHMLDMFQLSNSGREARNRAEKNRRDKLNGSIQELSTMVPHVAESPRRVDKTAVLRFAAHGLRLKYVFGESLNSQSAQDTDALMKLLDSFFITVTCSGQIVLVSSSIEQHLGHCQADLYGQNILHITHPEDHQMLKQKIIPSDLDNLFDIQPEDGNGETRARTQSEEAEIDRKLKEDKRSFTIRLARSGPRSEPTSYELVKIDGSFRRSDMAPRGLKSSTFPTTLQLMRRSRGREDLVPFHTISGNDIVLIAIARIVKPPAINRSLEVNRLEYKTRHLIDGRIIDCDQRISLVAGYMTDEVQNLSPFTFIHQDDVRWVIVALRQMYDCHSSFGESTYRLFTRNGKIIYLHTKGFLEIDKNTNKVHSFICVNTLLDEEEGKRRVQHMKNKFSVIINTKITQSSDDVPASENPQQLEKAVLCLIQNLNKSASEDEYDSDAASTSTSYSLKAQQHHHHHHKQYKSNNYAAISYGASGSLLGIAGSNDGTRSTKTPPALIPPNQDSVKSSLLNSVNVVKTTAAKFLYLNNDAHGQGTSGSSSSSSRIYASDLNEKNDCGDGGEDEFTNEANQQCYIASPDKNEHAHRTSSSGAIKRRINYSISECESDEYEVPMQRRAIENVLSTSLQQLDNKLNQQLNTALELRDQVNKYEVPHTEERFADIMKEHQKQREMYINITNEFEVQNQYVKSGSNESLNSSNPAAELPAPCPLESLKMPPPNESDSTKTEL